MRVINVDTAVMSLPNYPTT